MNYSPFIRNLLLLLLGNFLPLLLSGATEKYRAMWRDDPSTSMVIGWNQRSGQSPVVYLDVVDYGQEYSRYRFSKAPDQAITSKGMNNHFVRLRGLQPNTVYYFVIRDSEGISPRFSFKTAPDTPSERLSIIAGGDSRNNRGIRQEANKLVGKLRPHVVLFNGDMTDEDTDYEWQEWFDDWQLSIAKDGRITPLIVARGNHEVSNTVVYTLFDLPTPDAYFALSMGGDLLRIYTLNSMVPAGGTQRDWLERDLANHSSTSWKIVQYHLSIRPHTSKKPENGDQYANWAPLFYGYHMNLAIESDAHVAKVTWPIRPSYEPGSSEGFIRDDREGTVFVGEGGWGAPLRTADDDKPWTRNSGSFNQFNWIFVDEGQIEVRTVRIADSESVREVDPNNIFRPPTGLSVWNPSNGDVVIIRPPGSQPLVQEQKEESFTPEPTNQQNAFSGDEMATRLPGFAMQGFWVEGAVVNFSTANEPPNMNYQLHRSMDGGKNFVKAADLSGTGKAVNQYHHTDNAGGPNAKYRLRRIFPNGETDYYLPTGDIQEDLDNFDRLPLLVPDRATQELKVAYTLDFQANVRIRLINSSYREVVGIELPNQAPGKYLKTVDLTTVPKGPYLVVIRANNFPVRRFRVQI